jgi:hypothetical protein
LWVIFALLYLDTHAGKDPGTQHRDACGSGSEPWPIVNWLPCQELLVFGRIDQFI